MRTKQDRLRVLQTVLSTEESEGQLQELSISPAATVAAADPPLKPSLPPLVASLIVVGWGCTAQNTYGGDVIAVIGIVISAVLFLIAYRRSEALMSAATALSTGVWAVVLTAALTEGSLVPLVVAAGLGVAMIAWGAKLTRK